MDRRYDMMNHCIKTLIVVTCVLTFFFLVFAPYKQNWIGIFSMMVRPGNVCFHYGMLYAYILASRMLPDCHFGHCRHQVSGTLESTRHSHSRLVVMEMASYLKQKRQEIQQLLTLILTNAVNEHASNIASTRMVHNVLYQTRHTNYIGSLAYTAM
jgi:hypothetical protein